VCAEESREEETESREQGAESKDQNRKQKAGHLVKCNEGG
jgi:hypothetical protein